MPNWCSNRMYFSGEPAQIAEIKRLASGAVTPFYRRATNEGIQLFLAGSAGLLQTTEDVQFEPCPGLTAAGRGVVSPENIAFTRWLTHLQNGVLLDEQNCLMLHELWLQSGTGQRRWEGLPDDVRDTITALFTAKRAGWGGKPEVQTIRRLVTESEVAVAGNTKFRFVGADAFSPDELRTDLFSDDEGGYVDCVALDAALLEKLQAVAEFLREAEGWEWCAGRMEPVGECREDAGTYRCLPEPEAVLTEAEEERLNELMARYDALENQCEESDLLEAEMKLMRCMAKVRAWTPEMRAGGGVVVSWRYGNVCVQRGVQLRSEDDAADDADRTEQVQEKASVEEISLPLLTKMSSERTLAVQAALMQQPDKSLALLAWTLCLNVFGSGAYSKPAQISLECKHYSLTSDAPSGKEGAAFMAMMAEKARLAALLPEGWSRDMTTFLSLSQEVLLSLLSFCTACSIHGVQTRECGHTSRSPLDTLESAIGFHMRDWWQPTKANFFGHLKKPQIIAALNEAGLSGAARDAEKMKKGDAAEHAEFHMKDNRWVPGWMCAPHPQTDATERTGNLADAA